MADWPTADRMREISKALQNFTGDELQDFFAQRFGARPRIINAYDGAEVSVGDNVVIPPRRSARFLGLGDVVVHGEEAGVYGIFVEDGERKSVPMPYRWDHPAFPNELVLIPT